MIDWFHVSEIADGVWQLTEPGHVCSWLVAGSRRAALIDTGCGIAPIRPVAESLTSLPITVVNTHRHFDHVGGNAEFSDIVIHPLGAAGLRVAPPAALLDAYRAYSEDMVAAFRAYADADARYFHLLRDADRVRPLPETVLDGAWRIPASAATRIIVDGDVIDLGDRALGVLHTPGHSPDCVSLDLVGERLLFGGDTVNTGPVYAQLPGSEPARLAASLGRLASGAGAWDRVLCSHFLRTEVGPGYLETQVAAFASLLGGEADLHPAVDCIGTPVREASFDGFSVLVAADWSTTSPLTPSLGGLA